MLISSEELDLARLFRDDFEAYARACLFVRAKSGSIQKFNLNRTQRHLHERLEQQRKEKGKVRALVLKGRQVGISTYISARFYWRVTHLFGMRAFILTHLDIASENLFNFAKRFHENCPPEFRPKTGKANSKELSFCDLDSGYKVATAGSAEVGRSETIQFFHGSEVAFWPNAQNHSAGIQQAIANVPGTEDIRESTANGIGNAFHDEWQAAASGQSEYLPIFLPWYWHEEYEEAPPADWTPPPAFVEYEKAYELTRAKTYWAWLKNRAQAVSAGGTPDEPCWQFKQEYPANSVEAFQTSGVLSFILPGRVLEARKRKVSGYGPIILGVDPARGGGDQTGIIDRQGRRLGGNVCKCLDLDDLMALAGEVSREIRRLQPLGLKKVMIDVTGLGSGLYDRLRELHGDLIEGVNFGGKAYEHQKYLNRRAEMWDLMRQWFDDPAGVQVPDDDKYQRDMCAVTRGKGATQFNSSGQLVLESKDHIRERVKFSPDLGDAAALTFGIDLSAVNNVFDDDMWASRGGAGWLAA